MKTEKGVEKKAIELAEKFKKHGYPFAAGSGFMTGTIDEESKYRHGCEIAVLHCELVIEWLISDDDWELEIAFWKNVKTLLEVMSKGNIA